MENRPVSVAAGLIVLSLAGMLPAIGEESAPAATGGEDRLQQAASLRDEARRRQGEADRLFAERRQACQKEYLVNQCIEKARRENLAVRQETRRMESEGRAIERDAGKASQAERQAAREAEMRQREAGIAQRQQERQAAMDEAAQRRQQHLADKARKAEEGQRRKAEEAERHRRKVAEHAARVAGRKAEATR